MAHIYSPNIAAVTTDHFHACWQQTRAMLKSGWLLKHSSDGSAKALANAADPANCKWVAPANVQDHSADGTGAIGAQLGKDFLWTGLTGLVSPSATNRGGSEGNVMVVTNATTAGNNTTWLITKIVSGTSCYARPLVPAAHTTAGTPGTTITVQGHCARFPNVTTAVRIQPATTGALGTATIKFSMDDGATYSVAVTIPTTGIVEIIDVNGVATGLYVVVAGSITNAGLGVDYWRIPWAAANDANTTTIRWIEKSWLTSTYSSMASGAWICLEGPCTLKIPFTAAPSGTFVRGENITQATSLAEGEVIGVTYEPSTGAGYMVVMPRLMGGSTGPEGWGTGVITGSKSGATVTPSAVPTRLVRETVFWRGTTLYAGTWYYQPILDATENSSRFGYLALQSGTTATIAPGGGGTNNAFPAVAIAVVGTGGSKSDITYAWVGSTYTNAAGKVQLFNANTIDRQNQSADGSFMGFAGLPTTSANAAGSLCTFMRFDNQEDGDIEPYACWQSLVSNATTRSRTANTGANGGDNSESVCGMWGCRSTTFPNSGLGWWATWRRRGLASGDAYADGVPFHFASPTVGYAEVYANNITTDPDKVASTAATTSPFNLEPINLFYFATNARGRVGQTRWLFLCTGSQSYDTYGSKTWVQMNPSSANNLAGIGCLMPWDGSTTPAQ